MALPTYLHGSVVFPASPILLGKAVCTKLVSNFPRTIPANHRFANLHPLFFIPMCTPAAGYAWVCSALRKTGDPTLRCTKFWWGFKICWPHQTSVILRKGMLITCTWITEVCTKNEWERKLSNIIPKIGPEKCIVVLRGDSAQAAPSYSSRVECTTLTLLLLPHSLLLLSNQSSHPPCAIYFTTS